MKAIFNVSYNEKSITPIVPNTKRSKTQYLYYNSIPMYLIAFCDTMEKMLIKWPKSSFPRALDQFDMLFCCWWLNNLSWCSGALPVYSQSRCPLLLVTIRPLHGHWTVTGGAQHSDSQQSRAPNSRHSGGAQQSDSPLRKNSDS